MGNPELDIAMAAAWPPAVVESHGDWLFRYTSGVTRRANSVLTLGQPADIDAAIAAAEQFYERHDAPPVFMATEASTPTVVIDALAERGYVATAPTWLLASTPADITAANTRRATSSPATKTAAQANERWTTVVTTEPTDSWFETYWAVDPTRGVHKSVAPEQVLREVLLGTTSAVFVELIDDGRSASVGQVVIGDTWACAQCLATAPFARRSGAGTQVMRQLALQAEHRQIPGFFAAVMASNEASLGLCERLSLRRSHQYSYYVRG